MNGENNNSNDNAKNSNITGKENDCNCKIKINCPMKGLFNSRNIVYQGVIFTKENIKNKFYR